MIREGKHILKLIPENKQTQITIRELKLHQA